MNIFRFCADPEGQRRIRWNVFLIILPAALLAFACGGRLADGKKGPYLDPGKWFSGNYKGQCLILDRNGNIKETATIKRRCQSTDGLRGICEDQIEYYYSPARSSSKFHWSVKYGDKLPAIVSIFYTDQKKFLESLRGESNGSLMKIEGTKRLPREKNKYAAVKIRSLSLPGPARLLWEVEEYTYLGFRLGTVRTMWYPVSK